MPAIIGHLEEGGDIIRITDTITHAPDLDWITIDRLNDGEIISIYCYNLDDLIRCLIEAKQRWENRIKEKGDDNA
jgi:hypothetical protein